MNLHKFGKKFELLKKKLAIFQNQKTGGLPEKHDHADLILKYSTGFDLENLQKSQMCETMKITGWRYGTMFLWNIIN